MGAALLDVDEYRRLQELDEFPDERFATALEPGGGTR
jgi:hypothetical protein